jgi:hypothetical protein
MSNTPKSDKRMPDGADSPEGIKRGSMWDGESKNCTEAFDGSKPVFPIEEKNYLEGAAGQK